MQKKLLIAIFLFLLSLAGVASANDWTWEVSVVPPDAGWDSAEGRSVRATLGWFEKEIARDPAGLLEHDLRFVYLEEPLNEENLSSDAVLLMNSKSIAILNFASDEANRHFVPLVKNKPMLLAHGEDIWLFEGILPTPNIFALELYRDYRTRALTDYMQKAFAHSVTNRVSMIVTRFSLNEEREAKICELLLSERGIDPLLYWTDASSYNTYRLIEAEIKSSLTGVLLCYVGSMATREIWRGVRGTESQYQLWYPGTPNETFLSYNGIVFADQNMKLHEQGGFIATKRKLWVSRAVDVRDEVAAGRAYALASWLIDAVKRAKRADTDALIYSLATAMGVPFGAQTLDISPRTHRPSFRDVYMLRIMNRQYELIDTLKVQGLDIPN